MNLKNNFLVLAFATCSFQLNAAGQKDARLLLEQWFEAVEGISGDLDTIKSLSNKVDINAGRDYHIVSGITALMFACRSGFYDIVDFLLKDPRINVNAHESNGLTALMTAVSNGREAIVKRLLEVPELNINAQDEGGHTALALAIREKKYGIAKLLLKQQNINVNAENINGCTSLMFETTENNEEFVKYLLEMPGINLNIAEKNHGYTALMMAISNKLQNIVKLFLAVPTLNFNIKNKKGQTTLDLAMHLKQTEIAQLIKNKIDELTDKAFEAIKISDIKTLKSVIEQLGKDIVNGDGHTLLDAAFLSNRPEIVEYLLNSSKNPQELLGRFPFEFVNPNSDLFKYFYNLAFDIPQAPTNYCQVCAREASKKCSGCKKVYYCSVECQKAHWKTHKEVCKN